MVPNIPLRRRGRCGASQGVVVARPLALRGIAKLVAGDHFHPEPVDHCVWPRFLAREAPLHGCVGERPLLAQPPGHASPPRQFRRVPRFIGLNPGAAASACNPPLILPRLVRRLVAAESATASPDVQPPLRVTWRSGGLMTSFYRICGGRW